MAKQRIPLNNFSAGELSQELKGRFDLPFYFGGSQRIKNFTPLQSGGARFRNGTQFISATFAGNPNDGVGSPARIIPFVFNTNQSYILEFTHHHGRVYRDGALLTGTALGAIADIVDATGAGLFGSVVRVTKGSHGFQPGQEVFINNVNGVTEIDDTDVSGSSGGGPFLIVDVPDANNFDIQGKITGTFSSSPLSSITPVQTIDHASQGPITAGSIGGGGLTLTLTLSGHDFTGPRQVWLSGIKGINLANGIFTITATTSTTFTIANEQGNFTGSFTSSPDSQAIKLLPYRHYDNTTGQYLPEQSPLLANSELFRFQFAQAADTVFLVGAEKLVFKVTRDSATAWSWQAYRPTANPFNAVDDIPAAVGFHESRLWFGGSNNDPLKLLSTKSGNFEDMTVGTSATDALTFTLSARKVHQIRWIESADKFMLVGSQGAIFKVFGGSEDVAITPTNISAKPIESSGASELLPVSVDKQIIYINVGKRKLSALIFDINVDGYVPQDLTKLSTQILKGGSKQIDYKTGNPNIIYAVKPNGKMSALTIDRQENIFAWHTVETRSSDSFDSIAVIPVPNGYDEVWNVAVRSIGGGDRHYVERFSEPVEFINRLDDFSGTGNEAADDETFARNIWEDQKDAKMLDSHLSYDGSDANNTLTATITPDATTGTGIDFTSSVALFVTGDVGREIWNKVGAGRAVIKSFTSSTIVVCDIIVDFPSTSAIANGSWYLTAGTISGLAHLEGESVEILTDGMVHPNKTVSSGSVTLDFQASKVHVGFKYDAIIETMPLEGGGVLGPSQGRSKNVRRCVLKLLHTLGIQFGRSIYDLEKLKFRTTKDKLNRPPKLFSGDKDVVWPERWEKEKSLVLYQNEPLPCTIQMILPELDSDE